VTFWFIAAFLGALGGVVGELLEIRTSLNNYHAYPWERKYGRLQPLGFRRWLVLMLMNLILAAVAGAVVYGEHPTTLSSFADFSAYYVQHAAFYAQNPTVLSQVAALCSQHPGAEICVPQPTAPSVQEVLVLVAAGLAAPAVLQKFGSAIRK
jgi:hypothetical protein